MPFSQSTCSRPSGHRLHQQRERCAEAPFAGRGAPIVAEAQHDEIVRWDDQGPLPARSRHVIRLLGQREAAVAINPEEGAVDRTLVGFPCGSRRAHELGVAFGKNPLAVPHAVLQVKIAEARPIAPASELVALGENRKRLALGSPYFLLRFIMEKRFCGNKNYIGLPWNGIGRVPFVNDPSGFFPLSGTRLTVRTLGTQARNLRRDRSLPPLRLLAGIGFVLALAISVRALVGIGLDGSPCDATGRRPNVDNRCRGSKSRPHRPLDSSAS